MTSAVFVGFLDNANLVNARSLGRTAGVDVTMCLCEGAEGVSLSCECVWDGVGGFPCSERT